MSTVTEIEAAIERLPSDELRALVNWTEEDAAAIGASETLFGMYGARRSRAVTRAKRGEIWMADLGVAAKVRPVLVLSAKSGQSSAMSCVQPACAILSTKCVTKLVVCRTEHSTRKIWVHTRDQTRKASGTRRLRDVTWTSRPIGR